MPSSPSIAVAPAKHFDGFVVSGFAADAWAPSPIDLDPGWPGLPEQPATERLRRVLRANLPSNDVYRRVARSSKYDGFGPRAERVAGVGWLAGQEAAAASLAMGPEIAATALACDAATAARLLSWQVQERAAAAQHSVVAAQHLAHAQGSTLAH